ncbi:MAG: YIP1 family protein [Betaproteobacteria bacterium]|nr:YIP1 family protein [Betaproteobacteria bacterium]
MGIVDRVKNILLTPKDEWPVIAGEQTDIKTLYTSYIMLLAAIPAVAGILSSAMFAGMMGRFGASISIGFIAMGAILGYVLSLIMVYVVAHIADALAPSFDGEKNFIQSFKLVTYSMTASWVGGILSIIPLLGGLLALLIALYGAYIFYVGSTTMKNVPEAKAVGYTIVVIIAAIVVGFIIGLVTGGIVAMGAVGSVATFR